MKKLLLLFVLSLTLFCNQLKAQKTDIPDKLREARIDSLLNTILFDDDDLSYLFGLKKNYQFLYLRSNYNSQTFFAGREIGDKQYNISSQLFYMHSKGFIAGVSGAWYSELDPGYRLTVLTAGYSKSLKKHKFFRYRASYDYYLFNNDDPDFEPLYTSGINTGITLKSKILGTRFSASFLLGKEVGTQLSWDAFSRFTLLKFGKLNKLRFEPDLSLYFGSESVEYQSTDYLIDPLSPAYYYEDVFGLLNTQIELPLTLSMKGFDFEFAWKKNFPRSIDDNYEYPETSYFSFSIGYIFSL